ARSRGATRCADAAGWGSARAGSMGRFRTLLGRDGEQQGVALAAATAQGSGACTAAAPTQLVDQVQSEACTGGPDRVPESDGAAIDVDDLVGDAQVLGGLQTDRGEGLVDLDQVQIGDVLARLAQRMLDGVGGLEVQGVVRAGDIAV